MEEKLALTAYELRLAQEDISKLKTELQKKSDLSLAELSGKLFHLLDINLSPFFCTRHFRICCFIALSFD